MRRDHGHADERRVLLELPTQVALLAQPVQRVLDRVGAAVGEYRLDDGRQRLDGRDVAVQQAEGFAIVRPDADLEQDAGARCRSDRRRCVEVAQLREVADRRGLDDAAHLEPAHLADHDAVFDVDAGPGRLDHGHELEMLGHGGGGRRERLGHDGQQRAVLGVPDGDREGEPLRPAGELPGVVLDDQVQRGRVVANRPGERWSERPRGRSVDEHPRGGVVDERGSRREPLGFGDDVTTVVATEVLGDEGAQLDPEQPAAPVVGRCVLVAGVGWALVHRGEPIGATRPLR